MGQCTGNRQKPAKDGIEPFWKEPLDTQKLANRQLPKLQFQGSLSNFKIKNCVYSFLSIKVQINDFQSFLLKQKRIKNDDTAKWSFDQKFGFSMTQYELRKSFVKITFIEQDQKQVGSISINLYHISVGPYHQDYGVKLKKGQNFRVSFDMKISQVIEIRLDSIEAEVKLATKHPGQKFNYSIKTIVGYNTPLNISLNSYNVQVMIDDKQEKQLSLQAQSPQLRRRNSIKTKTPVKYIKANHNLVWNKQDMLQMPSVYMKILVSELHHSYFQILIWKINDKCITADGVEIPELYGQCYVALHKLFDKDPNLADLEGMAADQRVIEGNQKIWHHGRLVGTGSFKFNVINEKYIKQMHIMVRSEEGIVKHSPVFFKKKNEKSGCKQIQQIIKIGEMIEQDVEALDKIQNGQSGPSFQSRKLKISIERHLQDIVVLLEKSDKESFIFFYYNSELELYRAQQIFIGLGFKIITYLEEEDVLINQLCWQILIGLIKRGEFLLAHIGFDQFERDNIKKNNINKVLEQRIEIAVTYFELLRKLLELGLNSLNIKGVDYERCFAEMFCAYSYFRIPYFRTKFLQIISHQGDPDIPEWRGIQFSLDDDINYGQLQKEVDAFSVLCDWDRHFHKCLDTQQRYQSAQSQIKSLLSHEQWKVRMTKRGIAFFYFVKYWVEYIESIVVKTKDVQWKYFPGYNKLVKCFLLQMKIRPIMQYPDALKIACFKLLSNQKLLNPICTIIFNKANIYEPLTVVKGIQFLNQIFTIICRNGRKIPPTFNYFNLYRGIKIILDGDFAFTLSKTMIMIYAHYKIFSLQFRRHLSMYLMGKVFFHLFLHWSKNVRDIFYHLVVMRIYRESLHIETDSTGPRCYHQQVNDEIRNRYQTLMKIIKNAAKVKKQERGFKFTKLYEKDVHKKLKKKLQDKKKAQSKLKNSDFAQKQCEQRLGVLEPQSPNSEKIDKTTLFSDKYSTNYLTKQKGAERSQSQLIKPSFKMTYTISRKDPQVKRLKTDREQSRHEIFNHEVYDLTSGQKEMRKLDVSGNFSQYNYQDFQIVDSIEPNLLEYLQFAMEEFDVIHKTLEDNIHDKNWQIPKIRMQVPLDTNQIRPQRIDDL